MILDLRCRLPAPAAGALVTWTSAIGTCTVLGKGNKLRQVTFYAEAEQSLWRYLKANAAQTTIPSSSLTPASMPAGPSLPTG